MLTTRYDIIYDTSGCQSIGKPHAAAQLVRVRGKPSASLGKPIEGRLLLTIHKKQLACCGKLCRCWWETAGMPIPALTALCCCMRRRAPGLAVGRSAPTCEWVAVDGDRLSWLTCCCCCCCCWNCISSMPSSGVASGDAM